MNLSELRNKHKGEAAFCLGTAPHLNELDLGLLRKQVTIVCNQLVQLVEEHGFDYVCFQRGQRLRQFQADLAESPNYSIIVPEGTLAADEWQFSAAQAEALVPVRVRFTSPGHAEFFSFDLENCLYAGDSLAIEIQLAVWMGCNPIYVLGIDADDEVPEYFDASREQHQDYGHNRLDLREWLRKVKTMLWARGIRLFDAGGVHSKLTVLPKIRLEAATGDPLVAVTSKTFSNDPYLVGELQRYYRRIRVNVGAEKLTGDSLVEYLEDADAVILGTEKLSGEVISRLPCLRYVSKYGVGLDNIDFDGVAQREVQVAYRKGVNSDSVAELTLCHALNLLRRVDVSVTGYRSGKWRKLTGRELAEITLGIIGYGHVGKVVARKFAALGIGRLLVSDLLDFPAEPPAEFVPLEYLLRESDMVSLHVSMEPGNLKMVDKAFLGSMKEGALLINTARGDLLDEEALVSALDSGQLGGAALDVFGDEPTPSEALRKAPNLLCSCHIAGSSNRAVKNMGWAAIEGLLKLHNRSPVES